MDIKVKIQGNRPLDEDSFYEGTRRSLKEVGHKGFGTKCLMIKGYHIYPYFSFFSRSRVYLNLLYFNLYNLSTETIVKKNLRNYY